LQLQSTNQSNQTNKNEKQNNNEKNNKKSNNKPTKTQQRSILKTSTTANSPTFLSHIDVRAPMIEALPKDRETELREVIDCTLEVIRSTGTNILLVPKMDPDGKAISHISAKKSGNGPNGRGVTWKKNTVLPNLKAYTNDWITKPSTWDTATIQISIKTSKPIDEVYFESAIPLLNKGIEIFPRRLPLRKMENLPIGGILPGFTSLDHRALCFAVLVKHDLYLSFETVKIVEGKFIPCGVRDAECNGFLIVVADDEVNKGIRVMKEEWPAFRKKDDYMLGIPIHAYPFDHTRNFHRHVTEKFPNIPLCMLADYQHSLNKVEDGGGSIRTKFIAGVRSLYIPIIDGDGNTWTLRDFLTECTHSDTGKPLISSVCPIATPGNKKSVFTLFTTYRSGNKERTKTLANAAAQFIDENLAIEIWKKFGYDEATKVLAPAICQRIALRTSVDATDIPTLLCLFSELPEVESDHAESEEEDNLSRVSAYDNASV